MSVPGRGRQTSPEVTADDPTSLGGSAYESVCRVCECQTEAERSDLMGALRIGMQWDTEVTLRGGGHLVTQAYCSALPIAYSPLATEVWNGFARMVLDAAYEATLAAAVVNAEATGNHRTFLTLLGGGVFDNPSEWILGAIDRAINLFADRSLDVAIVSYGHSNSEVQTLVTQR